MTIPNGVIALGFIFEALFWLSVYFLIIRHGFRDKIHYMPVLAMCGNISWEFMLGMGTLSGLGGPFADLGERFPACPASWPSCPEGLIGALTLSAALLDVVIAYIIIRWGVRQFTTDWIVKYFPWLVLLGIGTAFVILITSVGDVFVVNPYPTCVAGHNVGCVTGPAAEFLELNHDGGFVTGAVLAVIMAALFISWIITRDDLRGQSFYGSSPIRVQRLTSQEARQVARRSDRMSRGPLQFQQEQLFIPHAACTSEDRFDGRVDRFDHTEADGMEAVGGDAVEMTTEERPEALHLREPLPAQRFHPADEEVPHAHRRLIGPDTAVLNRFFTALSTAT